MIETRRSPPPAALGEGTGGWDAEVLERLHSDFGGKCYLCEGPIPRGGFEVEHRKPKADPRFARLERVWTNLLPAHHDCNNRRPRKWPQGGLLKPGAGHSVEDRLRQFLDDDGLPHFAASPSQGPCRGVATAARNTAVELSHLHQEGPKAADLRGAIERRLIRALERLAAWQHARARGDLVAATEAEAELRFALSRRAPYTALIRSRLSRFVPPDFLD